MQLPAWLKCSSMAFELKPSVDVIGPGGVNGHVRIYEVGGEQFFSLSSNRLADKLFLHGLRSKACDRPSSRTTLINDIRKLKDEAVYSECKVRNKRWTREALSRLLVAEDTFKDVTLPAMGDEPSRSIKFVLNKPGVPDLLVECNSSTFAYLSRVMRAQFDAFDSTKQCKEESPIASLGLANMCVTSKNGRACVRASREGDNGGKACKYFRLDKHSNSVEVAAEKAQSWQVGECDVEAHSCAEGAGADGEEEED